MRRLTHNSRTASLLEWQPRQLQAGLATVKEQSECHGNCGTGQQDRFRFHSFCYHFGLYTSGEREARSTLSPASLPVCRPEINYFLPV